MTQTLRLAAPPTLEPIGDMTEEVTAINAPSEDPVVDGGGNGIWIGIGLVVGGLFTAVAAVALAVLAGVALLFLGGMLTFLMAASDPLPPEPLLFVPAGQEVFAPEGAARATAPPLRLAVHSTGRKTFELVNLANRDYTNVTVVMNGEYQYRLRKLNANAGDSMRYGNFTSRRTGESPSRKVPLRTLTVTADQGTWTGHP